MTTEIGWSASMQDVATAREHFDLLPTMQRTPEREKLFAMTNDYLSMPLAIFTRKDSRLVSGLDDLKDKTVAVDKGFVIADQLRADYPTMRLVEIVNVSGDALRALSAGEADAYVGHLVHGIFLIRQRAIDNVIVAAPTPYATQTRRWRCARTGPSWPR